jgi:hypothetical protein
MSAYFAVEILFIYLILIPNPQAHTLLNRRFINLESFLTTLRRMGVFSQLVPLAKPLAVLIGPAPIFYLYRSWESIPTTLQQRERRPLTVSTAISIVMLLIASLIYLCIALFGGSENIYALTQARFKTSITVIQSRLSRIRNLTAEDHILFERLATSLSERLNYAMYGPRPLIECSWCLSIHGQPTSPPISLGDPIMYLLYSLPRIVMPYLIHSFILGITTTPFLTSTQQTRDLRIYLSYALGLTLSAELWILVTFDTTSNSAANELAEVTWLHWELHFFRYIMLSLFGIAQAGLTYVLENGMIPLPLTYEDRLTQIAIMFETVAARMRLTRTLRWVTMSNPTWRERMERRWTKRSMEKVEIPVDIRQKWEREARGWVDGMIQAKEE